MFLSRNKKINVYTCKPKFYYIKVGFKGGCGGGGSTFRNGMLGEKKKQTTIILKYVLVSLRKLGLTVM